MNIQCNPIRGLATAIITGIFLSLVSATITWAQPYQRNGQRPIFQTGAVAHHSSENLSGRFFNNSASFDYGNDIVIHDRPEQNQQAAAVCSAINGWLYSAYAYVDADNSSSIAIFRSIDNGITWTKIYEGSIGLLTVRVLKIELLACGNDASDIKLFLGFRYVAASNLTGAGDLLVDRLNGATGQLEACIDFDDFVKDFSLATDFLTPSAGASPYSLALLVSKQGMADSLLLKTSSNGGYSFDNTQIVDLDPTYSPVNLNNVSVSFGRSQSYPSGRYFVLWGEQNKYNTTNSGHIFFAHTEPGFNSPLTAPVCLDSLNPSWINQCRNQLISTQFTTSDNDSMNISAVVLFQKYISPSVTELHGLYTRKAVNAGPFNHFTLNGAISNLLQSDICFNPYNSSFAITCFDSANQKLPLVTNDVNLTNPDMWDIVSAGYNDLPDLKRPNPKVEVNHFLKDFINVWCEKRNGENEVAMFDARYSTWTGLDNSSPERFPVMVKTYPNPALIDCTLEITLQKEEYITITLYNSLGQATPWIQNQRFSGGKHSLTYRVADLQAGYYLFKVNGNTSTISGKIAVIH